MKLRMRRLHVSTLTPMRGTRGAPPSVVGSPYRLAPSLTTFNFVKLHLTTAKPLLNEFSWLIYISYNPISQSVMNNLLVPLKQ